MNAVLYSTRGVGKNIETLACNYLIKHGLKPVASNYRCHVGEIDLIMKDKKTFVFVEVRYRQQANYGGALASITKTKQIKIIKTAMHFLCQKKLYDKVACRFDAVGVSQDCEKKTFTLQWYKNAFDASYNHFF